VERFLVVHGPGAAWAIRADHVVRFLPPTQWQGPAALTAEWSEAPLDAPLPVRCLLVFRTVQGDHAIQITAAVTSRDLESAKVRPLPAPCRPKSAAALVVSAVAIDGDETLFLIVEPHPVGAGTFHPLGIPERQEL